MIYSINRRKRQHFSFVVKLTFLATLIALLPLARLYVSQITAKPASSSEGKVFASQTPALQEPIRTSEISKAELITPKLSTRLQQLVDEFVNRYPDASFGISIKALDGSFEASKFPQQTFLSASLYKTLASYKILQQVDANELKLSQFVDGSSTLQRCMELAIEISDNHCGVILQSIAGGTETDKQALDWGYAQTTLSGVYPTTSAQDQTSLFSDIFKGNRLTKKNQKILLNMLKNQQINNRTPSYNNATIYHKTGDVFGIVNSSAIVESENTIYTISVLSDNWSLPLLKKYSELTNFHRQIDNAIRQ